MGKNILLTGGTRGIGAAIAEMLLESGQRVLCCGRGEEYHGPAEYFRCDVSQSRDRELLVEEALRRMGVPAAAIAVTGLNGEVVRLDDPSLVVRDGDRLDLYPPSSGG